MTFYNWICELKNLNTPFGDLAKEISNDPDFPKKAKNKQIIYNYLELKAPFEALRVFEKAHLAYSLDTELIDFYIIKDYLDSLK